MSRVKVEIEMHFLSWVCKFMHTPTSNEFGTHKHNRCFYHTQKWDESIVCSRKNCPLID